MHFSTKKMGVKFFHRKKTKPGGLRGVWQKTRLFPDFFSATFPKMLIAKLTWGAVLFFTAPAMVTVIWAPLFQSQ